VSEPQPPHLPSTPSEPPGRPVETEPAGPSAPQPFGPAPTEPRVGGCGKPALIGCAVVFLLLGIAGVALVLNAKPLLAWFLAQAKPTVLANAGPDVTAEDRARFERAFAAAIEKIRAGKIDPIALQSLQGQLAKAVEKPGVPRETFLGLTEAFERVGGLTPETAPPVAPPAAPSGPAPPPATPPLPSAA